MRLAFLCGEATSKSRCTTCQGQCIKTSRGSSVATHRSDVVGSLLRPAYLAEARRDAESGRLGPAEFKRIEDRAVDEAVALQEAAGLDVVTDGEMRRYAFFGHLIEALDGFDRFGGWAIPFRNEDGEQLVFKRPVVVERLRWRRSMCGEEFAYLRARARRPAKTTLISVQQAAAYYDPEKSRAAYPPRDAYLADVVDFTRREVEELIRLGCSYIQIDAPQYAPLRAVPDDRTVVLGLATTKKPRLETVEELAGRIEAAAQIVPLERLALSPQCGFASTLEGNRIPPETQRRKLEVVAATAREVWRS